VVAEVKAAGLRRIHIVRRGAIGIKTLREVARDCRYEMVVDAEPDMLV
jgi:hypothetical protein